MTGFQGEMSREKIAHGFSDTAGRRFGLRLRAVLCVCVCAGLDHFSAMPADVAVRPARRQPRQKGKRRARKRSDPGSCQTLSGSFGTFPNPIPNLSDPCCSTQTHAPACKHTYVCLSAFVQQACPELPKHVCCRIRCVREDRWNGTGRLGLFELAVRWQRQASSILHTKRCQPPFIDPTCC